MGYEGRVNDPRRERLIASKVTGLTGQVRKEVCA